MTYNAFLFPEAILDTPFLSILIYAGGELKRKHM